MVVQHNISAMTANRYYGINNKGLASSLEKLASGYAINRAGDNAAGLAVSEKMRAQIGGLTQASKNAEDGISLVQTMEGALQETDSILQRMRTLAVQSANGSYQDDVDRDAIQLEFDQLNDELNQIADTDFNGVVMLNGGEMADGLKEVDGKFDYANKADQLTANAKTAAQEAVDTAKKALDEAQAKFDGTNYDLSESGKAQEWNTVDQNLIEKNDLNVLWGKLGITTDGAVDDSGDTADTSDVTELAVTFTYKVADDGTGSWEATKGLTNGKELTELDETALTAMTGLITAANDGATDPTDTTTGYGGFSVDVGGHTANAVFNAHDAKDGDTVTLVFSNTKSQTYAPTNIGIDENTLTVTNNSGAVTTGATANVTNADLAVSAPTTALTDETITEKAANAYSAIEDAVVTVDYKQADITAQAGTIDKMEIELADGTKQALDISDKNKSTEIIAADGTKMTATTDASFTAAGGGKINFKSEDGKDLFTITIGAAGSKITSGETAGTKGKDGSVSAKISISTSNYDKDKGFGVTVGEDADLEASNANKEALDAAKAAYSQAQDDLANIKDLDSAKAYLNKSGNKVSESDTYDQSRAKMTYTDNMTLQVGARTKDIVNFTFSYNTDDLGGLEKNLNCSAREGGLNTANLSVSTAKDANKAIDEIDKALNKVNMVRATFGAVQNRLEHKIANLDTNTENMTAAESRIRDTQMDKEMMKFTSAQILSQASQSMLAQANSLPQGVLQLLG